MESVAAVESVADTVSEMTDGESIISHEDAEIVDMDDVISEPDFPGMVEISLILTLLGRRTEVACPLQKSTSATSKKTSKWKTTRSTCQFPCVWMPSLILLL